MKPHPRSVALAVLVGLLSGCASYPMGLSKAQWNALPQEMQARLIQEDAKDARDGRQRDQSQMAADAADWRKTDENSRRFGN